MVTIRYEREQAEVAARLERYASARRVATARGVARARQYAMQKSRQDLHVCADLRRQWEREVHQHAALVDRALYDNQLHRGDGMRSAAELALSQTKEAKAEVHAWAAERALDAERHRIAAARERVSTALRAADRAEPIARRRAVRHAEDTRSRRRVARPSAPPPPFATAATARGPSPLRGALRHCAGPFATARGPSPLRGALPLAALCSAAPREGPVPGPAVEMGAAVMDRAEQCAAPFEAARREARTSRAAQLLASQRAARARVAEGAAARREAEARAQREAEERRERVARVSTIFSREETEMNAREPSAMKRRAAVRSAVGEAEFAALFLRGPFAQSAEGRATCARATEEEGAVDVFPLAHVDALLPSETDCAVRLLPRPFAVTAVALREETACEMESDAERGPVPRTKTKPEPKLQVRCQPGDHQESAEREEESTASFISDDSRFDMDEEKDMDAAKIEKREAKEELEETKIEIEENKQQEEEEEEGEQEDHDAASTVPFDPLVPSALGANATSVTAPLDRPHEQFLRSLTALQERLARATEIAAADAHAAISHTNLSISTMSSLVTGGSPSRMLMDESATPVTDTSGNSGNHTTSSSSTSPSSLYTRPYPTMTADQLKAALLQMKARMQSA